MPPRIWFYVSIFALMATASSVEADGPTDLAGAATQPAFRVAVVDMLTGERSLVVEYPWTVHARPSVEVRLVAGAEEGPPQARPMYFVEKLLHGAVTRHVCDCLADADGVPIAKAFTEGQQHFTILGRPNSLGKPAVCVARKTRGHETSSGAAAVFCLLSHWAGNERTLHLDLPEQFFSQPGRLHIWFLRKDTVLWQHQLDWPGYGENTEGE
jgi:hypothetical protein